MIFMPPFFRHWLLAQNKIKIICIFALRQELIFLHFLSLPYKICQVNIDSYALLWLISVYIFVESLVNSRNPSNHIRDYQLSDEILFLTEQIGWKLSNTINMVQVTCEERGSGSVFWTCITRNCSIFILFAIYHGVTTVTGPLTYSISLCNRQYKRGLQHCTTRA